MRVLVLLPMPGSALTACFSGPYVIKSKVSDHSRKAIQGEQEKSPETAAPHETTAFLVCVESLPDDGLAVLGSDQQSGRLSNTEFLSKIDARLNYLPADQRREIVSLMCYHLAPLC